MSSRAVIDSDGDIVLQLCQEQLVGEEAREGRTDGSKPGTCEFVVSSKVLSLASPVFRAILNGKFKESVDFGEKKAASEQYTLRLEGDDYEATALFCRVTHFKANDITDRPTTACLEKLAYLCDKYQCVGAVKYCGGIWVRDWIADWRMDLSDSEMLISELCQALVFAYVMHLRQEFLDISWILFRCHKGPLSSSTAKAGMLVDHPLFQQDVAGKDIISLLRSTYSC
jgi:hypothetical protein